MKWIVRALLALPLVGAFAWTPSAIAADKLIIGYSMAKTGPYVSLSQSNEIAADMAVDEINAEGGVNGKMIELVKFDTSGDPKQAAVAARKFASDDNALAIIGPFSSSEAEVAFKLGDQLGIVQMPMASSKPKLAAPFKFGFRNTTNEVITVTAVLKALKKHNYPHKTTAIAYGTDDAISKAMGTLVFPLVLEKKGGVEIVQTVTFKIKGTFDLSAQVAQLVQSPSDLVAVGAPPEAAIILAREMRRQGHKGRLIAGATIADPELPQRMGEVGEGTVMPTLFFDGLNERTKQWAADFAERAEAAGAPRKVATQFDASTYDIVYIFAEAMKRANVTGDPEKAAAERDAIREEIANLQAFPALEGPISFNEEGDALKTVYVLEMKEGEWRLLESFPASELVGG